MKGGKMEEFLKLIEEIRFNDPDEFFRKKIIIKEKYQKLDRSTKEIYKWYFYFQLCLLKNPLKELFWTFLNEEVDVLFYSNLNNEYRLFCNRRKRQMQEESEIDKI